jgi:hypothetical protein
MGYEIIFYYKSEVEKGVYGEEVQTKKVKVGSLEDNLGLEAVAGRIFAQFARRNILVVDVEVWEYTKKKLTFREADDGFVIRNKKFKFDEGATLSSAEELPDEQHLVELLKANPALMSQLTGRSAAPQPMAQTPAASLPIPGQSMIGNRRPIRFEVYDPAPELVGIAKQNGLYFTSGKRYPIYGEKTGKGRFDGMIYLTIDDNGVEKNVSDRFFVGPQARLEGDGEFIEDRQGIVGGGGPEPKLAFQNSFDDNMPSLRR